jgi:hypothetical protein
MFNKGTGKRNACSVDSSRKHSPYRASERSGVSTLDVITD